jgi:hypothetical protein
MRIVDKNMIVLDSYDLAIVGSGLFGLTLVGRTAEELNLKKPRIRNRSDSLQEASGQLGLSA